MKKPKPWIVGAALVLVALAVPFLAGCGGGTAVTPAADPFIGTWKTPGYQTATDSSVSLVIATGADGYLATFVYPTPNGRPSTLEIPLVRQGDKLVGTFRESNKTVRAEVAYLPASGRIAWANSRTLNGPLNKPNELTKASVSTAIPTVLP
jgi:hypothetical protein